MSESDDILAISRGSVSVALSRKGAELRALRIAGHDLLWTPDPSVWSGVGPILFPIIARATTSELGRSHCTLVLTQDEETLKQFPFPFGLSVTYSIGDEALDVAFQIRNEDDNTALPVSLGFHPGFRWPLEVGVPKSDYFLHFDADEALV